MRQVRRCAPAAPPPWAGRGGRADVRAGGGRVAVACSRPPPLPARAGRRDPRARSGPALLCPAPGGDSGPRRPAVSAGRPLRRPPPPDRGLFAGGERPLPSSQRRRPAPGRGSPLGRGCCGSGGRGRPGTGGRGGLTSGPAECHGRAAAVPRARGKPGTAGPVPALRWFVRPVIRCAGRRTCGCLGSSCCELRLQRASSVRFCISRVLILEKRKKRKHPVCVQRQQFKKKI